MFDTEDVRNNIGMKNVIVMIPPFQECRQVLNTPKNMVSKEVRMD